MNIIDKLNIAGIVPVVVIDKAEDAVPTAKAILAGGIDVMEITFRTEAAKDAIAAVAAEVPEMTVGAGTVLNLEQCKSALGAGAKFIVSPGFSREIVEYCVSNDVAVTPGCVTPTEIMEAISCGLKVVKFFPANIYGGLDGMKALAAPFTDIKFIPTGGVNADNLSEYVSSPLVHAVGGSWICKSSDIAAHNFDRITELCAQARKTSLGFEVAHIGINTESENASLAVCAQFTAAFDFPRRSGNASNFSTNSIEVMRSMYLGKNGHIAIRTNCIARAIEELKKRGFETDPATAKYKAGVMQAIYLKEEMGGFAVHLVQK